MIKRNILYFFIFIILLFSLVSSPQIFIGPFFVGLLLWKLGTEESKNRLKQDAIRDLMTFRGDYAGPEFRRSLNKIAIVFHDDKNIRLEIRHLYEVINNSSAQSKTTERTIVGLIYNLCQKNGFGGLSEYDIDQSFVKESQNPEASPVSSPLSSELATRYHKRKKTKK